MRGRNNALRHLVEGAAAGLIASFASKQFQGFWNSIQKSATGEKAEGDEHQDDLATVKVADEASELATGAPVPEPHREQAGELVHYLTGAALGALYGLSARSIPSVTAGYGTAYGAAANLLLNEALLPALGFSPPPARTPPVKHLYAAATHLVFGLALEASRRVIVSWRRHT
jgi:hypothetical protein